MTAATRVAAVGVAWLILSFKTGWAWTFVAIFIIWLALIWRRSS